MGIKIQQALSQADNVCDYIPVLSTATNLVDLFLKAVVVPSSPSEPLENRYYTHLQEKSAFRSFVLLLPLIGNIAVAVYDLGQKFFPLKPSPIQPPQGSATSPSLPLNDHASLLARTKKRGYIPQDFQDDDENSVASLLKKSPQNLQYASDRLRKNRTFLETHLGENYDAYEHAHDELKSNRDFGRWLVQKNPISIRILALPLQYDEEILLDALIRDHSGEVLRYALNHLLDKHNEWHQVSDENTRDRTQVRTTEDVLRNSSLWNNRAFILRLVQGNGIYLKDILAKFRSDKEIVKKGCRDNLEPLLHAEDSLRKDVELIQEIVLEHILATVFVVQADLGADLVNYLHTDLKENRDFALWMMKFSPSSLNWFAQHIQDDQEMKNMQAVMQSLQKNPLTLEKADDAIKKDLLIVATLMYYNGHAFFYAHDDLKAPPSILSLMKYQPEIIVHLPNKNTQLLRDAFSSLDERGQKMMASSYYRLLREEFFLECLSPEEAAAIRSPP